MQECKQAGTKGREQAKCKHPCLLEREKKARKQEERRQMSVQPNKQASFEIVPPK